MSLFRRAYEGLFSPRRNADIINESTKEVDEDQNSFSDDDQVEDSSYPDHSSDPNCGFSKGMNNSINGCVDHAEVSGSMRKRKQSLPRKCVMADSGSEESPGKLQIIFPDDEDVKYVSSQEVKKGGGDDSKNKKSPVTGRKKKKELQEVKGQTESEAEKDEEESEPRRSKRSRTVKHPPSTSAASDEEESPVRSRGFKGKEIKKQEPALTRSPTKAKSIAKKKDDEKDGQKTKRRAVKSQERENGSSSGVDEESPVETAKSKRNRRKQALVTKSVSSPTAVILKAKMRENSVVDLSNEPLKAHYSTVVTKGRPPIKNPYVLEEDEALLSYLARSNLLSQIKGNLLWQQAEDDKATKSHRTWQSMKERFRKHILPNMHQFKNIPQEDIQKILGYWEGRMPDSLQPHVSAFRSGVAGKKASIQDESHSTRGSISDQGESQNSQVSSNDKKRKKLPSRSKRKIENEVKKQVPSDQSQSSEEDEEGAGDKVQTSSDDVYLNYVSKVQRSKGDSKAVPRGYTRDEDLQLMALVFNRSRKRLIVIGGNNFWKEIEPEFDDRTWSSLKERFLKRIIPQLASYCCEEDMNMRVVRRLLNIPGLMKTEKEKEDLMAACQQVFYAASQTSEP